ncbi:2-hydroxyacid dehydrogenase [Paraburkholderia fungorum]|jgi:hydroxypyruvate reductase|uniref:2-hydroxyacid dehydrogenase n=1 Tax=Paraburkholderia fungorum TaxID=134537 RepID=UPI0038BCAB18
MSRDIQVLIKGPMLPSLQNKVEQHFNAIRYWELNEPDAWLREHGGKIRGLVTSGTYGATAALMDLLPSLEGIFSFGVGYDSTDVVAAKERGVVVTNTPNVLDDCVADCALALMLDLMRRISESDRFVRDGRWRTERFPLATKLGGKRLGIVGLGNIGEAIARRAAAFGMEILYHNRSPKPGVDYQYFARLDDLIDVSNVLMIAVPGGRATDKLIDANRLKRLGKDGFLINISRGTVIDEQALVEALQTGAIAGAALDVFEREPEVPAQLLAMQNVVLTPHLGSGTVETRYDMGELVWQNLEGWFRDKQLLTQVV